jgi:hypothetical protein
MRVGLLVAPAMMLATVAWPQKLTQEQRLEITRGLSSEWAVARVALPRSEKALEIEADGQFDKKAWNEVGRARGGAAKIGDLVQITKLTIESDKLVFEINGGGKSKKSWRDRIQVGVGGANTPISGTNAPPVAALGTSLLLRFNKDEPPQDSAAIKKMLSLVLDFSKRSAVEMYVDKLPPEQKKAIEDKRVIEGMEKDAVLLAIGKPNKKFRDIKDGIESEDWVYGAAPGKVTFITFADNRVVKIRDLYGNIGGSTVPIPTVP